uniref:Galectin n=1 Tax=Balaenoptera musculus TaxID=9771 RepID=A0A8C0DZ71_BALMU
LPSHETPRLRGNAAQRARVPAKRVHCGGLLGECGTGGGGGHRHRALCPLCCLQFEAFYAGGLAPGWNLLVQGHSDSGEDKFEINFLSETGDIVFHIKPRFSSATIVANTFQGGHWGQEEVSNVFPLVLGEPFEMEVSSDAEHFHVHAQEHKVLQFSHRHRPLAAITRVQVLSDHRLAQVELARRGLSWG